MPRLTPGPSGVLLVVDVQHDFVPGGALAVSDGDQVVPLVNALAARFAHVVLTQDWHPPGHVSFASSHPGKAPFETIALPYGDQVLWPDHCVQGTPGAALHRGLDVPHAELIVRKGYHRDVDSYSALREADRRTPTGLAGYLKERGFRHAYLVGLATDFCVAWSARDAREAGFAATVVDDACHAIDTGGSLARAWAEMTAAGVARARAGDLLG
jgi:nicotinamidase/pyrazinamidase